MSITVSECNRAVSQVAVEAITTARRFTYRSLFALPGEHNIVNGTFFPFTSNVDSGWWGSQLSDSNGNLAVAAVLTVVKRTSAYAFTLNGINGNYPVDFTITLYYEGAQQHQIEVTNNTQENYVVALPHAFDIDTYVLSVTRISRPSDVIKISTASFDTTISNLMKEPGRHIRGRVEVTYTNALQDASIEANAGANGAEGTSLSNGSSTPTAKFFRLYDNVLDGSYKVIGDTSDAGWWPKTMPDASGVYTTPQTLTLAFSARNIYGLTITCDPANNSYLVDFTVTVISANSTEETITVTDYDSPDYFADRTFYDVVGIHVTISKTSAGNRPAIIMEVPIVSSVMYNAEDLVDVSLLEELTYEDSLDKLGGVSANELTVTFSNEDKSFYFNSASRAAGYLKKNRKVQAWLGVDIPNSTNTIWSSLGTYWTYSWDIPVGSLIAKTTAFDTIGLLGTLIYYDHQVIRNATLGALVETVLTSAKRQIAFLEWSIDTNLYDITIPVAWFTYDSYAVALNRLASCYFLNIYCDREGQIVAKLRQSSISAPDDVWSDTTNIIEKTYPTLYTALPNYLDVKISHVTTSIQEVLNIEELASSVSSGDTRDFNFSAPVESISTISIDTTATYTYAAYSWGIRVRFTSNGILNGIVVTAAAITVDAQTSVHMQNDEAIAEDGIIHCEISSDLIQTSVMAQDIAQRLYGMVQSSMYDVDVQYRGDIMLSLNNKVELPEGIAPDNLYYIKRHELYWNGALSGSARLGT